MSANAKTIAGAMLVTLAAVSVVVAYLASHTQSVYRHGSYTVRDESDLDGAPHDTLALFIEYQDISDAELVKLLEGGNLVRLYLADCANVTDDGIAPLSEHEHLEDLNLQRTAVTGHGPGFAGLSYKIYSLNLSRTNTTSLGFLTPQHNKLYELDVSHSSIGGQDIERIADLPSLKNLDISMCPKLTTDDIAPLGRSKSLQFLTMDASQFDVESVSELMRNDQLKVITLRGAGIADQELISKTKEEYSELKIRYCTDD